VVASLSQRLFRFVCAQHSSLNRQVSPTSVELESRSRLTHCYLSKAVYTRELMNGRNLITLCLAVYFFESVIATKGFLPLILETSHETAHSHPKLAPREGQVPKAAAKTVTESGNNSLDLRSVLGLKATAQMNKAAGIDFYACARPRVVISASSKLRNST